MTATKLDELSVHDFDDATDYTVDIRSGSVHVARPAESANAPAVEAPGSGAMPDAQLLSLNTNEVWIGEVQLTAEALAAATPTHLARGTNPLQPAIDPHLICNVALHEVLTTLLALEALVTRCGGFMRMDDQAVLFAARELLKRHGRRT
jgi:hypothetical protein